MESRRLARQAWRGEAAETPAGVHEGGGTQRQLALRRSDRWKGFKFCRVFSSAAFYDRIAAKIQKSQLNGYNRNTVFL
jgi:hypothetical protein